MSGAIERVARALCAEDSHDPEGDDCWNFGRDHSIKKKNWEAYVGGASAAIEAMPEPTQEMSTSVLLLALAYLCGFVVFLLMNLASGPVTPAFAVLRAVVWPVWITTGWPG